MTCKTFLHYHLILVDLLFNELDYANNYMRSQTS